MDRYKSSLGFGGIPSSVEPTTANIIAQQSQVEIDREIERLLDGQIERQIDRQLDKERQLDGQLDREVARWIDKEVARWIDRILSWDLGEYLHLWNL